MTKAVPLSSTRLPTFHGHRNRSFDAACRKAALGAALVGAALALGTPAVAKPRYPGDFTAAEQLDALAKRVGLESVPVARPPGALDRVVERLENKERVRALQLGDSHIAADYITGMIRDRLQARYGDGGRGFVHIDQLWGFGGRRTRRGKSRWTKTRVVDKHGPGKPFGFSGISLVSKRKGAKIAYRVLPGDEVVRVYFHPRKGGPMVDVRLQGASIGRFSTGASAASPVFEVRLPIPEGAPPKKRRGPDGWTLHLVAEGAGAQLLGLAFEKAAAAKGLIYESVGPVGADAKLWLETGRESFVAHLEAHDPDLVVLMVGGNDALKIRKRWTTLEKVRQDHVDLIRLLRATLPEAEILLWTPMDAGDRRGSKVTSKRFLDQVRDAQIEVAKAERVAYWDTLEAMGGPGSVAKWHAARLMNKDLVHPRKRAADLLGRAFAEAFTAL